MTNSDKIAGIVTVVGAVMILADFEIGVIGFIGFNVMSLAVGISVGGRIK